MKTTLRLPTAEQYAYIELEIDAENIESAVAEYHNAMRAIKGGGGLDEKEYNAFIDRYLLGEKNHVEDYEKMDDKQKDFIQTIKRSLARIKARVNKQ